MGATMTVRRIIVVTSALARLGRISVIGGAIVVLVTAGNPEVSTDPAGSGDAPRTLEVRRRYGVGQHHR
jgi:hypothetical protein